MSTPILALRRPIAGLLTALLLAAAAIVSSPAAAHAASAAIRLVADGPVETAVILSAHAFPDGASEVLLGTAEAFPDNLASGVLQDGRPLLLTDPDGLDPRVADELTRLGATAVTVLGGEAAVAPQVALDLEAMGLAVDRLAGATRIETAVEIAAASGAAEVLLARAFPAAGASDPSQAFADSLAAGAAAADGGTPVLLTQTEVLTGSTATYLADAGITDVTIVGGTAAVSDDVADAVADLGITVNRIAGQTRFETAAAVAAGRDLGIPTTLVLTEGQAGDAWISGFAAAAHAAATAAPVLLSNGTDLPGPTAAQMQAVADGGSDATLLCTPSTTVAACDAAAAIIGATVEAVTLDDLLAEPAPEPTLTEAPQLLAAAITGGDATSTTIILTFDEAIAPLDQNRIFAVSPWFDLDEIGRVISTDSVVGDPTSMIVVTDADELLAARLVTVYVAAGAVEDADGNHNTPGTAGLQDVTIPPDRTDAPDLVSVTVDSGATANGDGDETVDFIFDQPIAAITGPPAAFRVLPSTGLGFIPSGVVLLDDLTVRATFGFGQLSDAVIDDLVRAIAEPGAVEGAGGEPSAPIDIELGTPAADPGLIAVIPDRLTGQVVFRFDEPIEIVNEHEFFIYNVRGETRGGAAFITSTFQTGPDEVTVTYGGSSVHEGIVGGYIRAAAVRDVDMNSSRRDSLAVDASYPAGYTSGPDVVSVERVDEEGSPTISLVVTFDQDVTTGPEQPIVYATDGTATPLQLGACADGPATTQVTCTVADADPEAQAIRDAVAVGLPGGVAIGGPTPGNPPTTVLLSS